MRRRWIQWLWIISLFSMAPALWAQCTCYTTDTFGNRHYYDCTTGAPCNGSSSTTTLSTAPTNVTTISSSGGGSFLTAQIDDPNVLADGMRSTTMHVQTWYQNTYGVSYPASSSYVLIHGAYGGDQSGFTDSSGNVNFIWTTVDAGTYGITAHWGSLTTSVQVSPTEVSGSWINLSLPASGTYPCRAWSLLTVPFAWQWHSAKYGLCCYRLELLHTVIANNRPILPYNKVIYVAHYSNNRDDQQSWVGTPCDYGAYNTTSVDLYYYHTVGSWNSYAMLTTSNMTTFYCPWD